MTKPQRYLKSPINILMIILVAGIFVGNIPAYAGSDASVIMSKYEKGLLTEAEFEQKLRALQFDDENIRQAKAVIGKLEHQQEGFVYGAPAKEMETNSDLDKPKVTSSDADNLLWVMVVGGIATAAAIIIAFSKKAMFAS